MDFLSSVAGVLGTIVFVAVLFGGLLLTVLGVPGTLLIVLDAAVFSAFHGWQRPPWWLVLVLLAVSLVAEVADNILGAVGTRKFGGSRSGTTWAMVGGLLGAVVGGMVLGPPLGLVGGVLGPLAGGLVGGFVGGYYCERRQGRSDEEARRAGMGAVLGRVAGALLKTIWAAVMVVIILIQAF